MGGQEREGRRVVDWKRAGDKNRVSGGSWVGCGEGMLRMSFSDASRLKSSTNSHFHFGANRLMIAVLLPLSCACMSVYNLRSFRGQYGYIGTQ